jgi:hypothetical protein
MTMNRRRFLGAALGAAATVAVVRFAIEPAAAAPAGPPRRPGGGYGDMTMPEANGEWMTHLLPFAAPFPNEEAARAEVARGRKLRLFR